MKTLMFRPAGEMQRPMWNRDFATLQRAMEGLFDELRAPGSLTKEFEKAAFNPPCDIKEGDGEYLLTLDIPGVKKEEVSIEVSDGVLTVSGERKEEHTETKGRLHRVERFKGAFTRSFGLDPGTDSKRIRASYKDGVLRLLVPKPSLSERQQIRVGEEESPPGQKPATQH